MTLKTLGIIIGVLSLIVISFLGFCNLTSINETVKKGSAYGFSIGDGKKKVFQTVAKNFDKFDKKNIFGNFLFTEGYEVFSEKFHEVKLTGFFKNHKVHTYKGKVSITKADNNNPITFSEKDFEVIAPFDTWRFFNFENENLFILTFEGGKLIEIHRLRSYCELP